MGVLIVLVVLVLLFGGAMWITFGLVGLLLTLFVAGLVGWAADAVVPGRLPGGWLGAVLAGILGGFLGTFLLRAVGVANMGPALFGVHLLPAFVGAVVIAGAAELLSGSRRRPRLP